MIDALRTAHPRILVVGDLMLDAYMWGSADRISPEAPVPVVAVTKETQSLGGAGNVVANLLSLGAHVCVSSVLGHDDAAGTIKQKLIALGADTSGLFYDESRTTSLKTRLMAGSHQIVRFDKESKDIIGDSLQETVYCFVKEHISHYDALLLSDYKKGVLGDELTIKLIALANDAHIPVLADPKGTDYSKYAHATLLTPNKKEAAEATKIDIQDNATLLEAGMKLKNTLSLTHSLITLSEDGIGIFDHNHMMQYPTLARAVYDVTGAGDTVLAALGIALALRLDIAEAARFANLAAAVVVGKVGSATATIEEIISYENRNLGTSIEDKILDETTLMQTVDGLKRRHKKIVFTNGCFDILHAGHVTYLAKARTFGDILIVGLNTDASVRVLKGTGRPINTEADRAKVLASLGFVDYVVLFGEETPKELIERILPDILVKGADYKPCDIVGYDAVTQNGGSVVTVELVKDKSTTKTIEKIQQRD